MIDKTQVAIIGAGPAGLTLGLLLHQAGIHCVILEHRSRLYVESRSRAGVLDQHTVNIFEALHVTGRLKKKGQKQHGVTFSFNGTRHRINFDEFPNGRPLTVYSQQEVVKDLNDACKVRGIPVLYDAAVCSLQEIDTTAPTVYFQYEGLMLRLNCDFIAGCDGFHGVSRNHLPKDSYRELHQEYPFSWLGILARVSPASSEFFYAFHNRGFAMQSLRGPDISRLYLQVTSEDVIENWTDERIWEELHVRFTEGNGFAINAGEIIQKEIIPLRSFMIDRMNYGRLFIAGDAAHIVPPSGGKGLNLAVADVERLATGLIAYYNHGIEDQLKDYTNACLNHVWQIQEFSNFIIRLLHKTADENSFEYYLQKAQFDHIIKSNAQATVIAEHYAGVH